MNYLGDKSQSQRSSSQMSKNRHPPSTPTPLALPQPPNNPRPPLLPPPTSLPRKDRPVQETSQPPQKEIASPASTLSGDSKAFSSSHSKSSSKGKSPTRHSDLSKQTSTHREEKPRPQCESSDREVHHRSSVPGKNCSGSEKKGCKSERSTGRSNPGSCETRNDSKDEEHHRSSPPLQNSKGITSSAEKKRSLERNQDAAKVSEHADHSYKKSHSRADVKCKCHEQRSRSSDTQQQKRSSAQQDQLCQSDGSKERTGDRPSKSDPRKEDRLSGRSADKPNRQSKRSTSSERSRNGAKRSSNERDGRKKEGKKRVQDALKDVRSTPNVPQQKSVKEGSPHRKLCFMETLNLTRSPIKKPALSGDDQHVSVDALVEKEPSGKETSELDIEDMHVIDEVSGEEFEAGAEDAVEQAQKSKDPQPVSCEDDVCIQAKDHNGAKSAASDQRLQEHLVQTGSAYGQPIRTEADQESVCLTHTSPDSSSFQAGGVGSPTNMASNSHNQKSESVQPTAGKTGCGSSPQSNSGNVSDTSVIAEEPQVTGSSPKQTCSSTVTELKTDQEPTAPQLEGDSVANAVPDAACLQSRELCQESRSPAPGEIQEKDSDVVSSTISLESLPQEGLSLPDAIYILTQTDEATSDVVSTTNKSGCVTGCDAVPKISSTTTTLEVFLPDADGEPSATPEKSFSPGKSHENDSEPPSSKAFLQDEDSMMRILSNLKMIPDAISPLRSPIQASKRSHDCAQSKQGHVKRLEKGIFGLLLVFLYLSDTVLLHYQRLISIAENAMFI